MSGRRMQVHIPERTSARLGMSREHISDSVFAQVGSADAMTAVSEDTRSRSATEWLMVLQFEVVPPRSAATDGGRGACTTSQRTRATPRRVF
jgi:hypothetical protein